jgi:hypothetical protein
LSRGNGYFAGAQPPIDRNLDRGGVEKAMVHQQAAERGAPLAIKERSGEPRPQERAAFKGRHEGFGEALPLLPTTRAEKIGEVAGEKPALGGGIVNLPGRIADRYQRGDDSACRSPGNAHELHTELLRDRDRSDMRETFSPAPFKNSKCLHAVFPRLASLMPASPCNGQFSPYLFFCTGITIHLISI